MNRSAAERRPDVAVAIVVLRALRDASAEAGATLRGFLDDRACAGEPDVADTAALELLIALDDAMEPLAELADAMQRLVGLAVAGPAAAGHLEEQAWLLADAADRVNGVRRDADAALRVERDRSGTVA